MKARVIWNSLPEELQADVYIASFGDETQSAELEEPPLPLSSRSGSAARDWVILVRISSPFTSISWLRWLKTLFCFSETGCDFSGLKKKKKK